jgi:hypothetical protein
MRFISLFFGKTIRNMVTRQSNGRDVPVQFQGWQLLLGGPAGGCGGEIDHWADTRGYVLVISRDNLAKVGHAI